MSFRELTMIEVREVIRRWQAGRPARNGYEDYLEPRAPRMAPWLLLLQAFIRARYLSSRSTHYRERSAIGRGAGGCLKRLLLGGVSAVDRGRERGVRLREGTAWLSGPLSPRKRVAHPGLMVVTTYPHTGSAVGRKRTLVNLSTRLTGCRCIL